MALTFTDRNEKVVLHSWGRFRATLYVAVVTGDLLGLYSSTSSSLTLADDSSGPAAIAVACENIDAGGTGWCALAGEFKAPVSVGARGAVTRTYFDDGTDVDIGQPLYLDEDGKCEDDIGTVTKQLCGYQIARDRILLCPGGMVTGAGAFTTISASDAVSFDSTLSVAGIITLAGGATIDNATYSDRLILKEDKIRLQASTNLGLEGATIVSGDLTVQDTGSGGDIIQAQGLYHHFDGDGGGAYIYASAANVLTVYATNSLMLSCISVHISGSNSLYFRDVEIDSPSTGRLDIDTKGLGQDLVRFTGGINAEKGINFPVSTEGDLNFSSVATGEVNFILPASVADALSIHDGSSDVLVVNTAAGYVLCEYDVMITGASKLYFRGAAYIRSNVADKMHLYAPSTATHAIQLQTGDGGSVGIAYFLNLLPTTSVGTTEGDVWYDQTTKKLHFWDGDSEEEVNSSTA